MRISLGSASLLIVLGLVAAEGQHVQEYQLKAELLERFTRFVDWPRPSDPAPFVIGVIGRNPFGTYLDDIAASRRINGRTVEVQHLTDPAGAGRCHVLFIAATESANIDQILARTRARPILTVGDTRGFGNAGVLINFYTEGSTVRFEINESELERSGLRASSKLLKLARLIERDGTRGRP